MVTNMQFCVRQRQTGALKLLNGDISHRPRFIQGEEHVVCENTTIPEGILGYFVLRPLPGRHRSPP